jgi:hypothetical protein
MVGSACGFYRLLLIFCASVRSQFAIFYLNFVEFSVSTAPKILHRNFTLLCVSLAVTFLRET